MRRSIGLLAAAACLLTAGCDYKLDPDLAQPTPPVASLAVTTTTLPPVVPAVDDPRRAVLAGSQKITKARTVQMRIIAEVVGGEPQAITGTGAFDLARRIGQLSLTLPNDQGGLAVVNVGNTYYVKSPQVAQLAAGKPWIGIDVASLPANRRQQLLGSSRLPATTDPVAEMRLLRGFTGEPEDLGPSLIAQLGPVHGYRMTADVHKLGRNLLPDQRDRLRRLNITTLPIEVFLDGFGFLRRIHYTLEPRPLRSGPGVSVTVDFVKFGAPVKITVPPAAKVTFLR